MPGGERQMHLTDREGHGSCGFIVRQNRSEIRIKFQWSFVLLKLQHENWDFNILQLRHFHDLALAKIRECRSQFEMQVLTRGNGTALGVCVCCEGCAPHLDKPGA